MKKVHLFTMYKPTVFLLLILLVGCNKVIDLDIKPLKENIGETILGKTCKVQNLTRSDGLSFSVEYDGDKPITITGNLPSFDRFLYTGNLLTGAQLSNDPKSQILFTFDTKGNLSKINFKGSDARGPFDYATTLTYDGKSRLTDLSLNLPIFSKPANVRLEYNANDNVTRVLRKTGFEDEVLLENHTFDTKKAPFLDQRLGQILSYFMVYSLLQGDANYTYFVNKNNVTSATITNDNGVTELSMEYAYNTSGYPTSTDIAKNFQGRLKQSTEAFTYKCE